MSDTDTLFAPLEGVDPARPGDPFSRLRYQYGQLLGAEDFAAEQRYHLLRERLLTATLHGHGTVWGLRIKAREVADPPGLQLICEPGLAVDALGRLIHVEQEVCLDITGLALSPFWKDLSPPEGMPDARRAHVVLSYRACLDGQVPAIAPPCSDSGEALGYSRVLDRWRLCLAAEAPADPHALARDWTAREPKGDLRAQLLDFILSPPAAVARFWSNGDEAPLLLATIDLAPVGDPAELTKLVGKPDNAVRALLPDVQTVASIATGLRMVGAAGPAPFQLLGATAASDAAAVTITADLSAAAAEKSLGAASVRVLRFDAATGWVEPVVKSRNAKDEAIVIVLDEAWTAPTTWQLVLAGGGAAPVLDAHGAPLAGRAGDPLPPTGQGRDAVLIASFTP